MHVVLVRPEIPQNTGNIARTAGDGRGAALIEPLGFSLDDKYLKRAGLDYWHMARLCRNPSWEAFEAENPAAVLRFATTKAPRDYAGIAYGPDDFLVFGRETKGLPEELLASHYGQCVRIPMRRGRRSLNLGQLRGGVPTSAEAAGLSGARGRGRLDRSPERPRLAGLSLTEALKIRRRLFNAIGRGLRSHEILWNFGRLPD